MTPRIVDERTCPACGMLQLSTTHPDALTTKCTDCGTSLRPPDPLPDQPIAWSGAKAIDEGAQAIREYVAKLKAREK